ncbi:pyridoxal phosphate-dependent aminotransferase [Nakamurella sp. YIM 132087]|uniref:Pyridoxal phosphate-dependent aminotransferase n=1 Tax=Nakamurella alba TaxID=2665158 RepID=A0A7K1FKF3_9ACTN|nr:pyridoxal phosphate-dependent aminotransferase [Nakamurella alba]MTD14550.1 pyridoxal phosphate-dependent aminotransferase [Nakamurella alba]
MSLVPRLRPFTTTIFAEMSALAVRTGSINLGQGFPDSDGPAGMLQVAKSAIDDGVNQYPPGPGIPALRSAIAAARLRDRGQTFDPDTEVLVTVGATEAIASAVLALVDAGDEVLLIEPYYDSYPAVVAMAGGRHVSVKLRPDAAGRFGLDPADLRAAVTDRTRMILINSPHNPTGTVFTREELEGIAAVAVEHDLVVVADEVYEYLTFDDVLHVPIATLPGMAERTLTVSSAGKTFNVTGWKIGWVCGPAGLVAAVRAAKQFLTFVGGAPFQPAVAHALEHEMGWVDGMRKDLQGKRDRLCAGLAAAGFPVSKPAGTYFVVIDIRGGAGDPGRWKDGLQFCLELPERAGVVAVPQQVFHDDPADGAPFVRFAFCKQDAVIDEAVSRLTAMGA